MNIDTIKKFGLSYATKKVIHNIFLRLDLIFVRDAIHTHFVPLIGKWTIVGGWVKHRADKRGKVGKLKYKSFVTSGKGR